MLKFEIYKLPLQFKFNAGTSRGVLTEKMSWILKVYEEDEPEIVGWGEVNILPKLSIDDLEDIEDKIKFYCNLQAENPILNVDQIVPPQFPAIRFGIETALFDLHSGGKRDLFETEFTQGNQSIPINGLVWMGDKAFMQDQIAQKIAQGFTCIKIKIGAIDFEQECALIASIREKYSASQMMIRLDANGAFTFEESMEKLNILAKFNIESIEQPIKHGQKEAMKFLCANSPIPIALDEELIGVFNDLEKYELLNYIKPQYIILKPALLGGLIVSHQWISCAENLGIGWWITSALESNIGLNAIAQFTAYLNPSNFQGLGTGALYSNNIDSPLEIDKGHLFYNNQINWGEIGHLEKI